MTIADWLSRDPLGEAGGINLYGFVGNNPVNKRDLLGLTNKDVSFLFVNYYTESCITIGASTKSPYQIINFIDTWMSRASFVAGLMGNLYRTDQIKESVPDCYVRRRDQDGALYQKKTYSLANGLNFSTTGSGTYDFQTGKWDGSGGYGILVCGKVIETIEWDWIPDPDDPCCK